MKTINVDLSSGEALNLLVGRQGESGVTQVVFNFSALKTEFGTGTVSLSVKRPKEPTPYAQTITTSGTSATWLVNETDTGVAGCGEIQLTYTVSGKVAKTVIYKYTVLRSIGADGEYPIPGQTWQQEIEEDIADIKEDLQELIDGGTGIGLTDDVKSALLQIAQKVVYVDDGGQTYYQDLYDALYPPAPPATLSYITCVYTQSGTVYDTDTLNSLKSDLVVTAHYSNGTTSPVTNYALSGTLVEGTSTITVSYNGKTTTFNVTVTHANVIDYTLDALTGVTWTDGYSYNKSTGELTATTGEHCTNKFEVQDCIYSFADTTNTATYYGLFMWDSDGNYLGYAESNNTFGNVKYLPNMQLKPDYKYALKVYNTGSFDSSTIKMMPVDNRANAVTEFSIALTDYVNSIAQVNTFNGAMVCELNISDILTAKGIPIGNQYNNYINKISSFGAISATQTTGLNGNQKGSYQGIFKTGFLLYQSNVYMQMAIYGVTSLTDFKSYVTNNNVTITFNY